MFFKAYIDMTKAIKFMPFKRPIPSLKMYPKEIIQQEQKYICMKMFMAT